MHMMFPASLVSGKYYWIGYHQKERNFVGIDNKIHLKYTNWYKGEPSYEYGNVTEKCAEMYGMGIGNSTLTKGKWNDNDCRKRRGYICKRKGD